MMAAAMLTLSALDRVNTAAFWFCHLQIIYVFEELGRLMLKEDKVRHSQGVSSGCEASWLWTVLHRGLWVCWHSRGTVVWEQLSHLAPAGNRCYLSNWMLNSLRVCLLWISVSICICIKKYTVAFFSPSASQSHTFTVVFLTQCLAVGLLTYP